MNDYPEILKNIKTFIFDYDGVLTDGIVILTPDGEALRTANVKDGYALQLAIKKNYIIIIISGAFSQSMVKRFDDLKIKDYFIGVENKSKVLKKLINDRNLKAGEMLYMGDDIPDYEAMQHVGFPCCPSDASPEIISISKYVSPFKGGTGCVRDVIEKVMKVQGKWMDHDAFHW